MGEETVRVSVKLQPQLTTWDVLQELWLTAEATPEVDAAWLFDHFYPINGGDQSGPCFEGWMALSYLAALTERLRFGLIVSGITYRHPAVLANMCATLDVASGGRLEIGLGAAWNEDEHRAYGIPFPPVGKRMDALDEACEVIHLLLTEPRSTFAGKHYQLTDAYCEPKPIQRPRPPLVLGGQGELRMLRIVAKWADQWNYPGTDADGLRHKLEVLHRHCAEVGRDPSEIEVSMHLFDPKDPAAAAELGKELQAAGADHLILYFQTIFDPEILRTVSEAVADATK
jgi:F420-dependent oxidoreductase-like protein